MAANGGNGNTAGASGGSGGSIWVSTQEWKGTGNISANGGAGVAINDALGGGGGSGGRIAIHYNVNTAIFSGSIVAIGGAGNQNYGGPGSVYTSYTLYKTLEVNNGYNFISTDLISSITNTKGSIAWLGTTDPSVSFDKVKLIQNGGLAFFPGNVSFSFVIFTCLNVT